MDATLPSLLVMIALLLAGGCLQQAADADPKQAYYAEYREAITRLDLEIEQDPENATAWCVKGMWLNNVGGQYDAAIRCYDAALAIDGGDPLGWYAKGIALWNLEDYDAADGCFAEAVRLDPALAFDVPPRPDAGGGTSAIHRAQGR
jgi:tetratricopeptide (TPR) repeat protein